LYRFVKSRGTLSEDEAKCYILDLSSALEYLHGQMKIVHRDVTLANIFTFYGENGRQSVKLGDFGLAAKVDGLLYQRCGTANYLAPEMLLDEGYDTSLDIWAMGVGMYYMLCGQWPFRDKSADDQSTYQFILRHRSFSRRKLLSRHTLWRDISWEAQDLILRMLARYPRDRMTAQNILKHYWLAPKPLKLTRAGR
jgi:ribosomal protein S6 kinase alpha-1/2/3/6